MKARVLAAALDERVTGAADAEISRAVHPAEASCDGDVAIAVSPDACVGPRSIILSQATLAAGATLGADCLVYPGVRIGWGCRVGDRAVLHHNASIGADGFSFVSTRPGTLEAAQGACGAARANPERNELQKIHTLSIVEIGDDVEVGALTAIDRGTLKPTRIGSGTKIDDLVMIGHNVEIGMDCLLCGQVGLAGGVVIGDGAVLGGRVAVADHLKIGAWAVVGAAACVGTNVPAGAVYAGYPAVPRAEALENLKLMRRLRRLVVRLTEVGSAGIDGLQSYRDNNGRRP